MVISPSRVTTTYAQDQFRREYVSFRCTLVQRIRDIPNDRFGIIYTEKEEMHYIHHTVKNIIQSTDMFLALHAIAKNEYSITRTFVHFMTQLDPIHLYPSYFNTAHANNDDKIAGYKTYSEFRSPNFWPLVNPLAC